MENLVPDNFGFDVNQICREDICSLRGFPSPSRHEAAELWFGQHVSSFLYLKGSFNETVFAQLPKEPTDIVLATGDHGPVDKTACLFRRLSSPVLWALGGEELKADSTKLAIAQQVIKDRPIFLAGRDVVTVHDIDFCGPAPEETGHDAAIACVGRDVSGLIQRNSKNGSSALRQSDTERRHASTLHARFDSKASPCDARIWNPRFVLSHDRRLPTDTQISKRLAQIGPNVRAAKARSGRQTTCRTEKMRFPIPAPVVHLHAEGGDTPALRSFYATNPGEKNFLIHQIELLQKQPNAAASALAILSMGDAIFSVREPTAVQDAPATGDAILNESTANWCRCILRGQAALGATQLRFAFETLPLSSFALNEPIKIGVLIEGIDATQEADWTRKLDDLRPRSASAHISFDVIGVDSLRSAKELVRTLSADALDAAFEAVMHS